MPHFVLYFSIPRTDVVIVNAQSTYQDSTATLLFRDLEQTFEALNAYLLNK